MLTKKEVSAFVDRAESHAHSAAKETYNAAIETEKNRIFESSKAPEIIATMQQQYVTGLIKLNETLNAEL